MIKPNRLINYWIEKNGQRLWIQGTQPTSSNPVITTQSPLTKIAEAEKAQTALNKASARGAFDVNATPTPTITPTDISPRYQTSTVSPDRYQELVNAQMEESKRLMGTDEQTLASQEASRRFFNQLNESGISQDELLNLTGTTDAQKARDLIEGRGGLSAEEQLALNEQYEALRYEKAKAKEQERLMTEEERIRADVESMYAPQYTAAREAAKKSQQTALRLKGRAAMGSQSAEQQQELIEYERQIESSIAAEQRIQEQMLLAQARGASEEEMSSLSEGLNNARTARQKYQEELELRQAGLDEAAIEKSKANNDLYKLSLDALKAGYEFDPESGKFTKLTDTAGGGADMELSQQYGFLVGADGQPLMNSSGNIVELPGVNENVQKIEQEDPYTGEKKVIGFFNPATGKTTYYGGTSGDPNVHPEAKNYVYRDESGSQCGEGVNDNTEGTKDGQKIWMGNTYDSKVKWIDDDITIDNAQPGNTLIIPMTVGGSLETGHVAMFTGSKGETVYVDEFNKLGDEKLTSGSYTIDELNKYAQATGQKWGFAPTQFKKNILAGGIQPGATQSALGGDLPVAQKFSEKEVLEKAKQWGYNINDPGLRGQILGNYNKYGILPENENIKLMKQQTQGNETAIQSIDDLLNRVDETGVGFMGSLTKNVPQTPGYYVATQLDTILGQIAIKKLLDVKASGGTFGALSEKELDLLKSSMGALKQGLKLEDFKKSLNRIKKNLMDMNSAIYKDLGEEYVPPDNFTKTTTTSSGGSDDNVWDSL